MTLTKMTRLASVDIGTNSLVLLVVDSEGDALSWVHEEFAITRLGQGVDEHGRLAPEAVERTVAALRTYAATMDRLGVERRAAVGTAVLRDAGEDADRLALEQAVGCPVEVISGQREAELVLAGVQGSFGALQPGTLLFDVGGGSTELVLCSDAGLEQMVSLHVGSVRMTERFVSTNPPDPRELLALRRAVRDQLAALPAPPWPDEAALVGLAGTVTSLATMQLGLQEYDTERVNGIWLGREQVEERIGNLAAMTLAQRNYVIGMPAGRGDIIVCGACIVAELMDRFGCERLRVSDRGVRWGLLWEL